MLHKLTTSQLKSQIYKKMGELKKKILIIDITIIKIKNRLKTNIKIQNIVVKMNSIFIHQIQIIQGLFLVDWMRIQAQGFKPNQIVLIIKPQLSQQQSLLKNTDIRIIECQWTNDLQKYSPIIIKYKCQKLLSQLDHAIKNNQCLVICQKGFTTKSLIICCLLIITKNCWNLLKTLQYIKNKCSIPRFSQCQIQYLRQYEKYICSSYFTNKNKLRIKNSSADKQQITKKQDEYHQFLPKRRIHSKKPTYGRIRESLSQDKMQTIQIRVNNNQTKFSQYHKKINGIKIPQIYDFQPKHSKILQQKSATNKRYHNDQQLNQSKILIKTFSSFNSTKTKYNVMKTVQQSKIKKNNNNKQHRCQQKNKRKSRINFINKLRIQMFKIYSQKNQKIQLHIKSQRKTKSQCCN